MFFMWSDTSHTVDRYTKTTSYFLFLFSCQCIMSHLYKFKPLDGHLSSVIKKGF